MTLDKFLFFKFTSLSSKTFQVTNNFFENWTIEKKLIITYFVKTAKILKTDNKILHIEKIKINWTLNMVNI